MPAVEELQERAITYFCDRPKNSPVGRPFNCCESVLLALKEYLGIESELIPKIGTGIGAGVSLNGLLCGSVSSIAMAIGIRHGRNSPEENPQPVWNIVDKYVSEFKDRFSYINCRELTGLNIKTKEGLTEYFAKVHDYTCADRIRFAVRKGVDILTK